MGRRKQYHNHALPKWLKQYANSRSLDYHRYSEYHMRVMDGGFTAIDIWTTEKYWVIQTDYYKLTDKKIVERGGEKGFLPSTKDEVNQFLDKLFFAADMLNEEEK